MAAVESNAGVITLSVGADDTDDGLFVQVVGEDHPRVSITSAGVAVGDGTEAPTLLEPPA